VVLERPAAINVIEVPGTAQVDELRTLALDFAASDLRRPPLAE
jgi:hypothetical protein